MIVKMNQNDIVEMANLCSETYYHDYYHGYDRNEAQWLTHAISIVQETCKENPHYIAIKDVDKEGKMLGFMLCGTFREYYSNYVVMDVKDIQVDYTRGKLANAKTVIRCFDYMIEHVKAQGGKHWRADSIHSEDMAFDFARFLQKRYGSAIHTSSRGVIK